MNTIPRSVLGHLCAAPHMQQCRNSCFKSAALQKKNFIAVFQCRKNSLSGFQKRSSSVRASGDSPDAAPASSMSIDEAYSLLNVKEDAGFDEILGAKNKLTSASQGDADKIMRVRYPVMAGRIGNPVETAYDILLMQSMKKRLKGEGVAQSVRFADVARRKPAKQAPAVLQKLPVRVETLPNNTALPVSAAFIGLSIWTLAQGLADPAGRVSNDAPGLQIALALGASVYLLTDKKRVPRGRAVGITVAGLLLGVLIGGGLQSWLRVDIVPIGGLASPAAFVSEFGILALWASVALLA